MMDNIRHNNREHILALLDKAENSVQIAVSWLTDEIIISKLAETAKKKKVELLLSCDALNVWRYSSIRELQRSGAKVLKTGTNMPGVKGFMHAKFMIVDSTIAYGGSFNFTEGANYNYENFSEYTKPEVQTLSSNFKNWFSNAKDYTIDFENPEAVKRIVMQSFEIQEKLREGLLSNFDVEQRKYIVEEATERELLLKAEIEKERKRATVIAVQSGNSTISGAGTIEKNSNGISAKPTRFYGGHLQTKFYGQKLPGSYLLALKQKKEIEGTYSFLKCRIEDDTLICRGMFQPDNCAVYDIRIEFRAGCIPQVYILNPSIIPNADIHIYNEGSLCLFYPGDLKWKDTTSIAEYSIPWVYEWILFYELYLLTGKWEGAFVPHAKINTNTIEKTNLKIAS